MRNALLAGTFIGAACGLVGWFLVLRAQVFASDALSHVAFTGALAAAAFGIDIRIGLFAATIVAGIGMGGLGERARADDVTIGTVFAWILGLGVLFLDLFNAGTGGGDGLIAPRTLLGALSPPWLARPLLFISIDRPVAVARALPARATATIFLVLVGADAA